MKRVLSIVLATLGALLLLASAATFILARVEAERAAEKAESIAEKLLSLIPEAADGVPDGDVANKNMSALSLDGVDYVGVLEIPAYGICLPVSGEWERADIKKYPCRYTGSCNSGDLIIGADAGRGQLFAADKVENGDTVTFMDTEGNRYTYEIAEIRRTERADTETLTAHPAHLTLFARAAYSMEYIIIHCNLKGAA